MYWWRTVETEHGWRFDLEIDLDFDFEVCLLARQILQRPANHLNSQPKTYTQYHSRPVTEPGARFSKYLGTCFTSLIFIVLFVCLFTSIGPSLLAYGYTVLNKLELSWVKICPRIIVQDQLQVCRISSSQLTIYCMINDYLNYVLW